MKTQDQVSSCTRIPLRDALTVLANARGKDDVVVTNQGSSRVWPLVAEHPLDFHFNPSTMGGAIPFALGIALAQPGRAVIAPTGDGSLLMSLGCLVTVKATGCTNLTIVLLDNNIYDVTGGQQTAASNVDVDFAALARAIGYPSVATYAELAQWESAAPRFLETPGPRFAWLHVEPALRDDMKTVQQPIAEQLARLASGLGSKVSVCK